MTFSKSLMIFQNWKPSFHSLILYCCLMSCRRSLTCQQSFSTIHRVASSVGISSKLFPTANFQRVFLRTFSFQNWTFLMDYVEFLLLILNISKISRKFCDFWRKMNFSANRNKLVSFFQGANRPGKTVGEVKKKARRWLVETLVTFSLSRIEPKSR